MPNFMLPAFFALAFWATLATNAYGFTCSKDCNEQCGVEAFGQWVVEPNCFRGCKAFATLKCYNITDPWESTMGEAGSSGYPWAAEAMRNRNPPGRGLTAAEKRVFAPIYGTLVDRVVVHENSKLMSTWGDAPFQVRVFQDFGQTYGHNIYVDPIGAKADELTWYISLGHELCHSLQYEARGMSLSKFGRDYFEGYASAGGYKGNVMEKECRRYEAQIEVEARKYMKWVDQHRRPWTLQVCNHSELPTIYVALGWPHKLDNGFSLVPIRVSQGWWSIEKNECMILLDGIDSAESVDVFAMGHNGESWDSLGPRDGPEYCIDPANTFKIESHEECAAPAGSPPTKVSFKHMTNPWRTDDGSVRTWSLQTRLHHLKVCNSASEPVNGAMLRYYKDRWRAEGWHVFNTGDCKDFSLGFSDRPVYWYGFNANRTWESSVTPEFCSFKNDAFYFDNGESCPLTAGASLVKGQRVDIQAGQNYWNFQ